MGWHLSGIPQINRCKKTVLDDGAVGPIRFDSTDAFSLDGERLILLSGIHGTDGAEYRTKHDTFTKIILHDVDSGPFGELLGPTWFEAFYKDGRIFTFGGIGGGDLGSRFEGDRSNMCPNQASGLLEVSTRNDPFMDAHFRDLAAQSFVVPSPQVVRFAWSLKSVRDRAGNTLEIFYDGYPPTQNAVPYSRLCTDAENFFNTALRSTTLPLFAASILSGKTATMCKRDSSQGYGWNRKNDYERFR